MFEPMIAEYMAGVAIAGGAEAMIAVKRTLMGILFIMFAKIVDETPYVIMLAVSPKIFAKNSVTPIFSSPITIKNMIRTKGTSFHGVRLSVRISSFGRSRRMSEITSTTKHSKRAVERATSHISILTYDEMDKMIVPIDNSTRPTAKRSCRSMWTVSALPSIGGFRAL